MNHNLEAFFVEQRGYLEQNYQELNKLYLTSTPQKEIVKDFFRLYIGHLENFVKDIQKNVDQVPIPKVFIGTKVTVIFDGEDDTEDYYICLPKQSDPDAGCISFLSPVGRQLLLREIGDEILLSTPAGGVPVTIQNISFAGNLILQQ
ncbi:GreA/GreB family elongation factor [Ferdinandcohnia sp. Marseille-Q9671]